MKTALSLFFIGASLLIFFGYIAPSYEKVKELRTTFNQYDEALSKSKELQTLRDSLLSKYNTFSPTELARLSKMLPDSVDNVKLVLDIDNIAAQYGLRIRNVIIDTSDPKDKQTIAANTGPVGSVVVSFTIPASYPVFLQFLKNLEQSLRLVDITSVSFSTGTGELTEYKVALKTYWLR